MGQVAVVGQEQQAFALLIEPAHGVNALIDVRHQIDGPRPAGGIVIGAQVAGRLVDKPVDGAFAVYLLAVDPDLLVGPELRDPARAPPGRRERRARPGSALRSAGVSQGRRGRGIC